MLDKIFLYREKEANDRDCCAYIKNKPMRFECGHYFGSVNLEGACYSGDDFAEYKNIDTILSENEYNALVKFSKDISKLGYGIKEGDERYTKGVELCKGIQPVYDKLNSKDAELFFAEIVESEREVMKEDYELSDEDIDLIFDEYNLEYRDRSIVGIIYENAEDLAWEEGEALGLFDSKSFITNFIDFEALGYAMVRDGDYIELSDGRIVHLMY